MIKSITPQETLIIRQQVMWPNKGIEYVKLENDNEGRHFGLFIEEKLISVISLFINENEAQFRKFATLKEYQGKGYGTQLLTYVFQLVQQESIHKIWCNSRKDKTRFYSKFGLTETNISFQKGGIDYVIMENIISY